MTAVDIKGERRMWQAVILRAIEDAIWMDPHPGGKRSERVSFNGSWMARTTATRMRDEAVFWLCVDRRDFLTVCDMAGVTPHKIRSSLSRIINAPDEEKARWNANGFPMSGLWRDGNAGRRRVDQEGYLGDLVLLDSLVDEAGGAGGTGEATARAERRDER